MATKTTVISFGATELRQILINHCHRAGVEVNPEARLFVVSLAGDCATELVQGNELLELREERPI